MFKHPNRENYKLCLLDQVNYGTFAKIYTYEKLKNGKKSKSGKLGRVENFNKKLCGNQDVWMKRQKFGVEMFYWLNYDRTLTPEELRQKIFFRQNGTSLQSFQLLKNAGHDLSSIMDNNNVKLSMNAAVTIFIKLLEKLSKLRKREFGHYDLKPDNVLVQLKNNNVKIINAEDILAVNIIDGHYYRLNKHINKSGGNVEIKHFVNDFGITNIKNCSKFEAKFDLIACGIMFTGLVAKALSDKVLRNFCTFLDNRELWCNEFRYNNKNCLTLIDENLFFWISYLKKQLKQCGYDSAKKISLVVEKNLKSKIYGIDAYIKNLKAVN